MTMRPPTQDAQRIARAMRAQTPPATYAAIGRHLGVSKQRAHQLVHDTDARVAARRAARAADADRQAHRDRLAAALATEGRWP